MEEEQVVVGEDFAEALEDAGALFSVASAVDGFSGINRSSSSSSSMLMRFSETADRVKLVRFEDDVDDDDAFGLRFTS